MSSQHRFVGTCADARSVLVVGILAALGGILPLGVSGCGYTSRYVAPIDGRARPVWKEDNVVVEMSGGALDGACAAELMAASASGYLRLSTGERRVDGGGGPYWVPRYYGAPILVMRPGLASLPRVRPVFLGTPAPGPNLGLGMARSGGGGRVGSGGGGGGGGGGLKLGDGKALALLAVVALIVLPIIDVSLALANPESPARSSQSIDQVNAWNDLARTPGTPCSYEQSPMEAPAWGAP